MTDYRIDVYDPFGLFRGSIVDFISLEYVRREGDYGYLYLDLPPDYVLNYEIGIDTRFKVMRRVNYGDFYNDTNAVWFVRLVRKKTDQYGKTLFHVVAHDGISIIDRRIVAYRSETEEAHKVGPADDMMKAIMRENFGSLAYDAARDLSAWLTIEDDKTLCPSVEFDFPYLKILPLFQKICEASLYNGSYLTFDMEEDGSGLIFRTYQGYRGTNRSATSDQPITLSIENGSLSYASVTNDHIDEKNYVYAGGMGEEENMVIQEAYDDAAINISPFNRCEDFYPEGDVADLDTVMNSAVLRIKEAKAKVAMNGHIQQLKTFVYGIDYFFGDIVTATYEGTSFDVHLDTVNVVVRSDGSEEVKVYSRNLDESEY